MPSFLKPVQPASFSLGPASELSWKVWEAFSHFLVPRMKKLTQFQVGSEERVGEI